MMGIALYRVGKYREALSTLTRSYGKRHLGASPYDIAFLAMTRHQLGEFDKAAERLQQLREFPANSSNWTVNGERPEEELQSLITEAAALIEGDPKPKVVEP